MNSTEILLAEAIKEGIFPGAAYAVSRQGRIEQGFFGNYTYCPDSPKVGSTTLWDLASVSKVVGTTTAVMHLVQSGVLDLNKSVATVIPEFGTEGKGEITFKNLMTHDSGLIAFRPYHKSKTESKDVLSAIYAERLLYPTGSKTVYSDLNMILIGEAVFRLTGRTLDQFLREKVFGVLNMKHTGYFDASNSTMSEQVVRLQCAPTERIEPWRVSLRRRRYGNLGSDRIFGIEPEYVQGEVHDPTATVLGGVAGHAGLFSTLGDLVLFMKNFTASKPLGLDPDIRKIFTKRQSARSSRAIGWDTKSESGSSAGSGFGGLSYGHTGYTGTSIWVDPEADVFAILLTNRVHPTSENTKILGFRPQFHESI